MSSMLRITLGAFLLLVLLPPIARAAAQAIPFVLSAFVFLVIAQLFWPSPRRRK